MHKSPLARPTVPLALGVITICLSIWIVQPVTTRAGIAQPDDRPQDGLIYSDLGRRQSTMQCGDHFVLPDGSCTHGPDPAPPGFDVKHDVPPRSAVFRDAARGANAAACEGDGISGRRVQVLYVRAIDAPDRYAAYSASIQQWAAEMDQIFEASAQETGGTARVRFVTNPDCTINVANVAINADAVNGFGRMIEALRQNGFAQGERKYLMFADVKYYCGIAQVGYDDSAGADNQHNFGPMYARVDSGCWSARLAAHELMHTLGAVQNSAPNTTRNLNGSTGGHCTDESDIMCYSDAADNLPAMRQVCPQTHEQRFDCNHDDYFHTNPPAASYLATHWNAADNLFLIREATAPIAATPTPIAATATLQPPGSTVAPPNPTATPPGPGGAAATPMPTVDQSTLGLRLFLPYAAK